jgi:hypothetical protein
MDAQEAVGEHAALEIGPDLPLDESRDRGASGPRPFEKRLQVLAQDTVEERLLGLVAFVANRGGFAGTGFESKRRAIEMPIAGCLGIRARRKSCGGRSQPAA